MKTSLIDENLELFFIMIFLLFLLSYRLRAMEPEIYIFTESLQRAYTLVCQAALEGNVDIAKQIENESLSKVINIQNEAGFTPLHLAVVRGHFNIVKWLLEHGSRLRDKNGKPICHSSGSTPLHSAVKKIRSEQELWLKQNLQRTIAILEKVELSFELLLKIKAKKSCFEDIEQQDDYIAIFMLVLQASTEVEVNAQDKNGATALFIAADNSCERAVQLLLTYRANPNIKNIRNDTPLHVAVEHADSGIVQILLARGANPNIQNMRGETPLHIAVKHTNGEIIQILLDNGADRTICNADQATPKKGVENQLVKLLEHSERSSEDFFIEGHLPLYNNLITILALLNQDRTDAVSKNQVPTSVSFENSTEILHCLRESQTTTQAQARAFRSYTAPPSMGYRPLEIFTAEPNFLKKPTAVQEQIRVRGNTAPPSMGYRPLESFTAEPNSLKKPTAVQEQIRVRRNTASLSTLRTIFENSTAEQNSLNEPTVAQEQIRVRRNTAPSSNHNRSTIAESGKEKVGWTDYEIIE